MQKIKFTIQGNPVPYLRLTQGELRQSKWLKIGKAKLVRKYLNWKEHVRLSSYAAILTGEPKIVPNPTERTFMSIKIYFKNKRHGDPDNIWKGIADAIFENDKHVDGMFRHFYDKYNPRVEVTIVQ